MIRSLLADRPVCFVLAWLVTAVAIVVLLELVDLTKIVAAWAPLFR